MSARNLPAIADTEIVEAEIVEAEIVDESDLLLERIIANGNRSFDFNDRSRRTASEIGCADGFGLSVIAGEGTYCSPRPDRYGVLGHVPGDYPGPYSAVEVGFPTARPEPWDRWQEFCEEPECPTDTVYGYVPVALVRELVAAHGGEVAR